MFGFLNRGRALERKAAAYVAGLLREPSPEDVAWLAGVATKGDEDHARWELRYACRAIGQVVAQRDALDDRTASLVARALTSAFEDDKNIDRERFGLVEQQFNARLSAYRDAMGARGADAATRMGQTLLAFSGGSFRDVDDKVKRAADIVAGYERSANDALGTVFGKAMLPENDPPSVVAAASAKK